MAVEAALAMLQRELLEEISWQPPVDDQGGLTTAKPERSPWALACAAVAPMVEVLGLS